MPLVVNSKRHPAEGISNLCIILLKYLVTSCGCHWDSAKHSHGRITCFFILEEDWLIKAVI